MNFFTLTHKKQSKAKVSITKVGKMTSKTPDKSSLITARFLPLLLRP